MKIVIFGANGMLGSDLGKVFYDFGPYLLDKLELDITNQTAVNNVLGKLKPDLIINAAGYTDVDGCEVNRDLAMSVNGIAPGYLAKAAKDAGSVFVHFSTDYVFHGDKEGGYKEDDATGPALNFYGETKLAGEKAIMDVGGKVYLVRTSWLFGSNRMGEKSHQNFVEKMIELAKTRDAIKIVEDQHGKPTYTLDLANTIKEIVDNKKEFGVYHIVNEPETTWYEFGKYAIEEWAQVSKIDKLPAITPCASEEFSGPAKRPSYSVLTNTKLPLLRGWKEAVKEYLSLR